MNCLVLGGAGFIGSHVVDALLSRGHRVRVFDVPNMNTENLRERLGEIELFGGDFTNVNDTATAMDGMDVVIHLAWTTLPGPSNENPAYDVESNIVGSLGILKNALKHRTRKIVFASSGGTVYGIPKVIPTPENHPANPLCSYGITKLAVEKYLGLYHHLHGLDFTVLRLGNPYGERQRIDNIQGAVSVFLGKLLLGRNISIWGDGSVARDYFHIGDLAEAFALSLEKDTPSRVYNIAGGVSQSLNDLLAVIRRVTGKSPSVEYTRGRKMDIPVSCLDISLAERELGWKPRISLEEGVAVLWEWLKRKGAEALG